MTKSSRPGGPPDRLVLDLHAAALGGRSLGQPLAATACALSAAVFIAASVAGCGGCGDVT